MSLASLRGGGALRRERVHTVDTPQGLDVTIDARPGRAAFAAQVALLAIWLIGELTILGRMAAYEHPSSDPFLVVTLAFWTLGGLVGARVAFTRIKRRELIRVDARFLHYRREYRWFRRSLRFEREEVSNLRALTSEELDPLKTPGADFWGWYPGGIVFEYRGALHRIASQLDRRESEALAARINRALEQPLPEP